MAQETGLSVVHAKFSGLPGHMWAQDVESDICIFLGCLIKCCAEFSCLSSWTEAGLHLSPSLSEGFIAALGVSLFF